MQRKWLSQSRPVLCHQSRKSLSCAFCRRVSVVICKSLGNCCLWARTPPWLLFYTTSSRFIKMQILFIMLEWCICLKSVKLIMLNNVCWHSLNIITVALLLDSWIWGGGRGPAVGWRCCTGVTDSPSALFKQVASPLCLLPICRVRLRPNCLRMRKRCL